MGLRNTIRIVNELLGSCVRTTGCFSEKTFLRRWNSRHVRPARLSSGEGNPRKKLLPPLFGTQDKRASPGDSHEVPSNATGYYFAVDIPIVGSVPLPRTCELVLRDTLTKESDSVKSTDDDDDFVCPRGLINLNDMPYRYPAGGFCGCGERHVEDMGIPPIGKEGIDDELSVGVDGGADEEASLTSCQFVRKLRRMGNHATRVISRGFAIERIPRAPGYWSSVGVQCGHLRSLVESQFPTTLPVVVKLSLKTVQKMERNFCKFCKHVLEEKAVAWRKARLLPVETDHEHLARFQRAVSMNVEEGWNSKKWPYIPNGHACKDTARGDGGNWVEGEFSKRCGVMPVISSGKIRIVTLYSEYNTRTLYSLHKALYAHLDRKEWLLRGSPTPEHIEEMSQTGKGRFVSVDYAAATDNIQLSYVRACIDILKKKASPALSQEESKCLDVLGNLLPVDERETAYTGQPMGSVVSFPLLCLTNKSCVDMALGDLLGEGVIDNGQHCRHRVLINGDDLAFREPVPGAPQLFNRLVFHGRKAGLHTNLEKTGVSDDSVEINSTLFRRLPRGSWEEIKKINVSALEMTTEVSDVLGFAWQASGHRVEIALTFVKMNLKQLSAQAVKLQSPAAKSYLRGLINSKKIVTALLSSPCSMRAPDYNPFPVVTMPDGFYLSRGEIVATLTEEVKRLRSAGYLPTLKRRRGVPKSVRDKSATIGSRLEWKAPCEEVKVLEILVAAWKNKVTSKLVDDETLSLGQEGPAYFDAEYYDGTISHIEYLSRVIKSGDGGTLRLPSKKSNRDLCCWDPLILGYDLIKVDGSNWW